MPKSHFITDRLILRPCSREDASFILELLNTPKWVKYIGDRQVHTVEEAEKYIADRMLPQLTKLGYGNYTMILKEEGTKIGTCGLYNREDVEGIDIGFATLPAYEKKGYAYEAASRILSAAFEEFGIEKVCGYTTKDNLDSRRLLIKLGFERVGTTYLPNDEEKLEAYKKVKVND